MSLTDLVFWTCSGIVLLEEGYKLYQGKKLSNGEAVRLAMMTGINLI